MKTLLWSQISLSGSAAVIPYPGDLIILDSPVKGQWPPDGLRRIPPGARVFVDTFYTENLDLSFLVFVLSVEDTPASWRMNVIHGGRLWWIPAKRWSLELPSPKA